MIESGAPAAGRHAYARVSACGGGAPVVAGGSGVRTPRTEAACP